MKDEIYKFPFVMIVWADTTTEFGGWFDFTQIGSLEPSKVYTPCWIIKEDDDNYYVVQNLGIHKGKWQPMTDTTIPKGCVIAIQILKKKWQ